MFNNMTSKTKTDVNITYHHSPHSIANKILVIDLINPPHK